MKKLLYILVLGCFTFALTNHVYASQTISNGANSLVANKLEVFIKEKKFQADETLMYPGISSKTLKTKLTELVNESAKEFMQLASANASDADYQAKIKSGLERFNPYFADLSSEDQDRIYRYYEQLIEIVGVKNAGDHLKNWRYGSGKK